MSFPVHADSPTHGHINMWSPMHYIIYSVLPTTLCLCTRIFPSKPVRLSRHVGRQASRQAARLKEGQKNGKTTWCAAVANQICSHTNHQHPPSHTHTLRPSRRVVSAVMDCNWSFCKNRAVILPYKTIASIAISAIYRFDPAWLRWDDDDDYATWRNSWWVGSMVAWMRTNRARPESGQEQQYYRRSCEQKLKAAVVCRSVQ